MASKRQRDHTVSDILRLRPKWFMEKQVDPALASAALTYVHTLMGYGQNHIADEPFIQVFEAYDFSIAPNEYSLINKSIMEYKPVRRRTLPPASSEAPRYTKLGLISPSALREALKPSKDHISQERNSLLSEQRNIEANLTDHQRQIRDHMRYLHEESMRRAVIALKLDALEAELESETALIDPEKVKLVKQIPSQWMVVSMTASDFTLIRREPLTMKYIGTAESGMAKTLYMGFMGFIFTYSLQTKASFNVADYIHTNSSNVIHPHVSGASICWGNQAHKAERYQQERDYANFFTLLESILTTYCPDNPYISFSDVERKKHSGYTLINANIKTNNWFKDNQAAIIRMLSETASDEFITGMANQPAPAASTAVTPQLRAKWAKFTEYTQELGRKIRLQQDQLNRYFELGPKECLYGAELIAALKRVNIVLPNRHALLKLRMAPNDVGSVTLNFMIAAYGGVPIFSMGQPTSYAWMGDQGHQYHVRRLESNGNIGYRVFGEGLSSEGTTTGSTSFSIYSFRNDAHRDSMVPPEYRPRIAPAPAMTAAVGTAPWDDSDSVPYQDVETTEHPYEDEHPEEDEESECDRSGHDYDEDGECTRCGYQCDHDRYSSGGHCRTCDHYDSYYDEESEDSGQD